MAVKSIQTFHSDKMLKEGSHCELMSIIAIIK